MRRFAIGAVLASGMMLAGCASAPATVSDVWLVRHAEKMTGEDPALTEAGAARALALAARLSGEEIARVHSSDTRRTRDTAAPFAKAIGVEVELYDPRDLPALAARLREDGGTHLVVGHSNTTPQLVEELGGDGGEPIVEATEYNRLYRVRMGETGVVRTDQMTFGE